MLSVILNEVRSFLRSGSNLFFTVFFPCACVFFLGTFLESVETSDKAVGELKIAWCADGGNLYSAAAFEEFINSLEREGVLSAEKISADKISGITMASYATAYDATPYYGGEDYSAAVELDGSDIVIHCGQDKIKNRTVKAIFDSYNRIAGAYMSVVAVNPAALADIRTSGSSGNGGDSGRDESNGSDGSIGGDVGSGSDGSIGGDSDGSFVTHRDLGTNRSMMDYYAVTMTVMILFMGSCIRGSGTYEDEHENFTINRLDASPVSRTAVFFGKIIGSMPMVLIQVMAVMLASTLLFGAHYCNSVSGNVLLAAMFITVSLAALSVGVFLNLIFPHIPSGIVIMPVLWLAMFFSGTFAMDIYIPGLTECMPMYIIQRAAFDLTVFGRTGKAVRVIAVSLVIFAVMLVMGRFKANAGRKNS